MSGNYYVYIVASLSRILYVGMTNDLCRRVYQHRFKLLGGFTARYNIYRLVHLEHATDVNAAIAREKQLKNWSRKKKVALIEAENAGWVDLAEELFSGMPKPARRAPSVIPVTSSRE
jgi:putative endonuclease